MKKQEIIKQMIMGSISIPIRTEFKNVENQITIPSNAHYSNLIYQDAGIVDLDKLANFLMKYVAKEDLIED